MVTAPFPPPTSTTQPPKPPLPPTPTGLEPTPTAPSAPTTTATQTPSATTGASTPVASTAPTTAPPNPGQPTPAASIQGLDPYQAPSHDTYTSGINTGYTDANQDVADIAGQYMSQDSLLMQKSGAAGRQSANSRGMMNSSIATTAGQSAALEHVVPMASQTAGQNFQRNLSNQQANEQSALSSQEFGQTSKLSRQEAEQQSGLSRQEFGQQSQLSNQEFQQTSKLAYEDYTYDHALMELDGAQKLELQKQGYNYEQQLQDDKQAFDMEVQKMQTNLQAAQQADASVAAVWDDYYATYNQIMANENLTKQQRQEQLDAAWETSMDRLYANSVVYGQEYNYDQPDQDIYNTSGPMYDGDEDGTPAKDTKGGGDGGTTDTQASRQSALSGQWSGQTWQNGATPRNGDTRVTANGNRQIYKGGEWISWDSYKASLK